MWDESERGARLLSKVAAIGLSALALLGAASLYALTGDLSDTVCAVGQMVLLGLGMLALVVAANLLLIVPLKALSLLGPCLRRRRP